MEHAGCRSLRDDITKMGRLATRQLQDSLRAFQDLDINAADHIAELDDVVDNLNLRIEERGHDLARLDLEPEQVRFVRSAVKVGANLERIADAACHIARRVHIAVREGHSSVPFDLDDMEAIAVTAVRESVSAYLERDLRLAESACLREPQLDAVYVRKVHELQDAMSRRPADIPFFMYWNSVLKYLEKVCDYTLNIGEQAMFLVTGRRLKFAQYQQLDRMVSAGNGQSLAFSPYYDGISGAVVARLSDGGHSVVYKQGSRKKIREEAERLQEWQRLFPSLTPRVIATDQQGEREALLREFVAGELLSDVYLSAAPLERKLQVTDELLTLTLSIWRLTTKEERACTSYSSQTRSRLSEVYAMHPYLEFVADREGLVAMLDRLQDSEQVLAPRSSVWLHGDFNMNNVIFAKGEIRFIDVHRSHYGDYLSDVGVFLVSTMRQPHLSDEIREQLLNVRVLVQNRVAAYAKETSDFCFDERLRCSLARSFLTSARVVVDERHARWLFDEGLRLLGKEVYP
jgi:phosphate uptake regulator/aminoglycoside phosphotransferase (APT) family kinase protein